MGLQRISTAGHLYVHYHDYQPRFLLVVPGQAELDAMQDLTWQHDEVLPIRRLPPHWRELEDRLHGWLHSRVGNTCRRRPNLTKRRYGVDASSYGVWVRERSLHESAGCYDLPLFDIDEADFDLANHVLVMPVETKRRLESFPDSQRRAIKNMIQIGIDYRFELM